jgi:hypothetical protein
MLRRGAASRGMVRPYQCMDCGQWHLTGTPQAYGHRPHREKHKLSTRNKRRFR